HSFTSCASVTGRRAARIREFPHGARAAWPLLPSGPLTAGAQWTRGFSWSDAHARVHDPRPIWEGHDRIAVELGDLRKIIGHSRDAQQHVDERLDVARRAPAIPCQ